MLSENISNSKITNKGTFCHLILERFFGHIWNSGIFHMIEKVNLIHLKVENVVCVKFKIETYFRKH